MELWPSSFTTFSIQSWAGSFSSWGEVFHLEEFFDVLCLDLGDDWDERVEPRPIDFDVDVWLEVDGYVGVLVLVSCC